MSTKKIGAFIFGGILILGVLIFGQKIIENVDSNEIVIIQFPTGTLQFATTPGPWMQWFGSVERFKRREQLWFLYKTEKDDKGVDRESASSRAMKIRFNDNGHALISGSIAWAMPTDPVMLEKIYKAYRTQEAIEEQLIKPVVEKSIYMSGPLMSSTESAAERRAELLQIIEDQIENGILARETIQEEQVDPLTKEIKKVNVVRLTKDKARVAESPLKEFGIKTYNLTINEVRYDVTVERQIQQQQAAYMQVRIAMANAKKAEQDALTVAEQGKADAAKAKWEQEKENATLIAQAEGKRKAEEQNAKAMEYYKTAQLLKAEADAGYRRKIMEADNALSQRLEAYVKTNELWANAFANAKSNLVPQIQTGSGSSGGNAATDFMNLLTSKAAKDLAVDMQQKR